MFKSLLIMIIIMIAKQSLEDAIQVMMPQPRFVVGIPHCGTEIPKDFPRQIVTYHDILVNASDIGAEDIFDLREMGGIVIKSRIHRDVVDLNRIRIGDNFKKYNKKMYYDKWVGDDLSLKEKKYLYKKYHFPFYNEIGKAMKSLKKRNGRALLISGHTFNLQGQRKPGICVGVSNINTPSNIKKYGHQQYASFEFATFFCNLLGKSLAGIVSTVPLARVGIDDPFDGSEGISEESGKPNEGCDALLVEVNRELFVGPDQKSIIREKIGIIQKCLAETISYSLRRVYGI